MNATTAWQHTGLAKMIGMSPEDIEALRNGTYFEPKLQALHHFTRRMVQARGWVEDHELNPSWLLVTENSRYLR